MNIGEQIRNYRKKAGISQKELGERLGVSQQHIAQYENGKRIPKTETLCKIADALRVGIGDLIELDYESWKLFDRLATDALNRDQESIQKKQDEAAHKAPRAFIIENGKRVEADRPIKFTSPSRSHAQTEAYDLFHSLLSEDWVMSQEQEVTAVQLKKILGAYDRLNTAGRKEAVKRVDELTELPRYTTPDELSNHVNAAHAIEGATKEDKQHDEDIMNDENF